jgi:hypothetical protein
MITDEQPVYTCQDCKATWPVERRTQTIKPLKYGERRAPEGKRRFG